MTSLLIFGIYCYRLVLRPLLHPTCRFDPSCSEYAIEALGALGFFAGLKETIGRLLRCHPFGRTSRKWGERWGYDPVPGKGWSKIVGKTQ